MLVSHCHCNKMSKIQWLKTTCIYYLRFQQVRSLKWVSGDRNRGVDRAIFLPEALGKNLFPGLSSFSWLLAFLGSRSPSSFKASNGGLSSSLSPFFFFFFCLFRAAPVAYGSSQARGQIGAAAASLHHSHSNEGSEPHL